MADRVVAIGDVHGDLDAARRALRLSGVIDDKDKWIGGATVVVQTGDILDRGDGERAIMALFESLKKPALAGGGAVHVLSGNHELMNVAGDFRYVTPGGFSDFDQISGLDMSNPMLSRFPNQQRARVAAFLPGGVYARKMAKQPVVLVVGDTVYAHGGVLPKHVQYGLAKMNAEVGAWLLGKSSAGARVVQTTDSPVWSRHFSADPDAGDCKLLAETLRRLKVKRMVVGHTVQRTIRPACDKQVWRIDVGMASHYGGKPEALLITSSGARALDEQR